MSDRPSAVNGRRNKAWGTTVVCPACGQCLCFGCHPAGPCVDERDGGNPSSSRGAGALLADRSPSSSSAVWYSAAR